MEQSQSIQESCPTICSSQCQPSCPFFVGRCLCQCQAHVQAVALWAAFCHANNVVKSAILLIFDKVTCYLSMATCNSLWRHVPGALLSCLIRTIVIFNKIFNTSRKCPAKLFAATKLCNTYTICPSFCSLYCSHSWPQCCCVWRQKSPYLFKTPGQTSPAGKSLAVQEADYKS